MKRLLTLCFLLLPALASAQVTLSWPSGVTPPIVGLAAFNPSAPITPTSVGVPASTCAAPGVYLTTASTTGIAFTATPSVILCVNGTAVVTTTSTAVTSTVPVAATGALSANGAGGTITSYQTDNTAPNTTVAGIGIRHDPGTPGGFLTVWAAGGGNTVPLMVNASVTQIGSFGEYAFKVNGTGRTNSTVNYVNVIGGATGTASAGAPILSAEGSDTNINLKLSGKGTGGIQIMDALVALGGGAAPTLGTIGGSGPATAGQNTWLRLVDSTGAVFWVPAWK